jgi:hypothetical protein
MNVVAIRQHGCIYLCDFRNDHDKIAETLSRSPMKYLIDALYDKFADDQTDDTWNTRLKLILDALEADGCTILWD